MKDDRRWNCIDLLRSQFYSYLDKHKVDLRLSILRDYLAELRGLEQKKAENLAGVLRRRLLKEIMSKTEDNCCFAWLPKKERKIVHRFIHDKRDDNFLTEVARIVNENPDSKIAVLLGARHIAPLKESLEL